MVVDAGGTTEDVATSVWGVKFAVNKVQFVWGNNGELEMSDVRTESLLDDNSNKYDGYVQTLHSSRGALDLPAWEGYARYWEVVDAPDLRYPLGDPLSMKSRPCWLAGGR